MVSQGGKALNHCKQKRWPIEPIQATNCICWMTTVSESVQNLPLISVSKINYWNIAPMQFKPRVLFLYSYFLKELLSFGNFWLIIFFYIYLKLFDSHKDSSIKY